MSDDIEEGFEPIPDGVDVGDDDIPQLLTDAAMDKFQSLVAARDKRDELETALTAAKEEYAVIDAEVWTMLDDAPMNPPFKIILPDGEQVVFHNKVTPYGKILDFDAAYDWAIKGHMKDALNEDRFVMARVNEEVRERRDNKQPMPPGIGVSEKRFVSITRQKP